MRVDDGGTVRATRSEVEDAIAQGRITAAKSTRMIWIREEDGTGCYTGGALVRDGRLYLEPGFVRAKHLPSGVDVNALLREGSATRFIGFWRAPADGAPYAPEALWHSDPDWFDGPRVLGRYREELDNPAWSVGYMGFSRNRVTGELNGTRTNFFVGARHIYAIPEGFTAYLDAGMQPRMDDWLHFCAEVDSGTLRFGTWNADSALAAIGRTWDAIRVDYVERVKAALRGEIMLENYHARK